MIQPAVEVVVSEPIRAESHQVHHFDGGQVLEERGDRRGRADRVSSRDREHQAGGIRAVEIEPRFEERRPTDAGRGCEGLLVVEAVGRGGERRQLSVVVADIEDGDLPQRRAIGERRVENLAAGLLRSGDAEQERDGRRDVDRADVRHGHPGSDARTAGQEGRVQVDVVLQIDQIRQIPVLSEELRGRDQLTGGRRVELVGRVERDHDVAAA